MPTTPKQPDQHRRQERLVLPLRLIDLDSPWLFGIGRDMTDEERENAERHGRYDNPPMSVLGVTHEGLAAVDGKELALLFVAAPKMLEALRGVMRAWGGHMSDDESGCADCEYLRPVEDAIREASGQNH